MFFYQGRSAVINLKPNESVLYRLPPMSVGTVGTSIVVQISQHTEDDFSPNKIITKDSIGTLTRQGIGNSLRTVSKEFGLIPPISIIDLIRLANSKVPADTEPGTPHVDWYAVSTMSVTLMHANTIVPTANKIVEMPNTQADTALQLSADSLFHDGLWRLRVQRNSEPSVRESRRYRIIVRYPSQMPEIEREIPLKFFQKAFEEIWNGSDIITASFEGSKIVIAFRDDFAEYYHLEDIPIPLPDILKINGFNTRASLSIGAGPRPNGQDGNRKSAFVSLRFDVSKGQIRLENPGPNLIDISFPGFYFIIRFYLHIVESHNRSLRFEAVIDKDAGIFRHINEIAIKQVREEIRSALEEVDKSITKLNGHPFFGVLDKYVKPWIVGGIQETGTNNPFTLLRMRYEEGLGDMPDSKGNIEPATGKLVVTIIARRGEKLSGIVLNSDDTQVNDGSFPLFANTSLEEQNHITVTDKSEIEHVPIPADSKTEWLSKIDHIVVLMQENRSFDQVLGYLSRQGHRGYLRIDEVNDSNMVNDRVIGLAPEGHNDHSQQMNKFQNKEFRPQKAAVYVSNPGPTWTSSTAWPKYSLPNPAHGSSAVADQINGGDGGSPGGMKGFVGNFAKTIGEPNFTHLRQVMDYFDESDLPIYGEIARQFGICDSWFCSFAGGTLPNRFVSLTGKLNRDRFGLIEESNPNIEGGESSPISTPTLFDYLTLYEKTWRVYVHGYGTMRLFAKHTFDITNVLSFDDQEVGFEASAKAGTLPDVTWIEPDYIELPPGNDDHAPADMNDGQILVDRIVRALVNSRKWSKTLLIITYDEHGGFYDHVTPPPNDPPLGDSRGTMGPRVPAFVISPLIEPRRVFHEMFDHCSIGATILRRFCMPPPKVSERLDKARDLSHVLELADSPVPRTDFGKFGTLKAEPSFNILTSSSRGSGMSFRIPQSRASSDNSILTRFNTDSKEEDFHWFLRVTGLTTGSSGNPSSFDTNSLRGWLMRNGFDASQSIRSIMSILSVSSVRQLIKSHT